MAEKRASRFGGTSWRPLALVLLAAALARINPWTDDVCFWNDEAFSWAVASAPFREMLQMVAGDTHPPGHYVLMHVWIRIAGDSIFSMRLLSGLFSLASVACVYWFTREGFTGSVDRPADLALVGTLLTAINPACASTAYMARMYAMLMFGTMLCALGCVMAFREPRRFSPWALWVVGALVALYSHNYGMFVLAGSGVWLLGAALRTRPTDGAAILPRTVLAGFVVVLCYAPWVTVLVSQAQRVSGGFWIPPMRLDQAVGVVAQLFSEPLSALTWTPVTAGLLAAAGLAFALMLLIPWFGSAAEWLFLAMAVAHAGGILIGTLVLRQSVFEFRYLVHLVPLAMVALASRAFVLDLGFLRTFVLGAFVAMVGCSAIVALLQRVPAREAAREATAEVRKRAVAGDVVLGGPDCFFRVKYYLTHPRAPVEFAVYAPSLREKDRRLVVYAPALLREHYVLDLHAVRGRRVWAVTSHYYAGWLMRLPGYTMEWAESYTDEGCADTRHMIVALFTRSSRVADEATTGARNAPSGTVRNQDEVHLEPPAENRTPGMEAGPM